jgi:hypothetical protein
VCRLLFHGRNLKKGVLADYAVISALKKCGSGNLYIHMVFFDVAKKFRMVIFYNKQLKNPMFN